MQKDNLIAALQPLVSRAQPKILDLFCGAGGAGMGYSLAGFDVYGVDLLPQKRYPFAFHQGDVIAVVEGLLRGERVAFTHPGGTVEHLSLTDFDAIHASPPCQAHTSLKSMHNAKQHLDLVPATRRFLDDAGVPWIIENVVGAPLIDPVVLCGTMFGLGVSDAELRRHRLFEGSFPLFAPRCQHGKRPRTTTRPRTIGIYGEGCRDSRRKFDKTIPEFTVVDARVAMGIDWMTLAELCQAIPPSYTAWLGRQVLDQIRFGDLA